MEKLPKKIFERDIESVDCGLSDIYFFKENEIEKGQAGFRFHGLTGEIIKDWIGDNFYVIGIDSCGGDPIIVDISKEELPIYFMFHDDWTSLQLIAESFDQFLDILYLIDDGDFHSEEGKDKLIANIKDIVPEEGYDYWEALIQSGYEFVNDL